MTVVEPFEICVADEVLDDLRTRLERTRFPDQIEGTGWEYGTPVPYVRELVEYWCTSYDWRTQEARLNELDHFHTNIDGQSIHFIHARSGRDDAFPILLLHGWPGSIVEFLDVIPDLARDFHVVAPSLPGYGFSEPTRTPGWDPARIARAFMELMARLGYERYGAQGGDWGAQVATHIAASDTDHCVAVHLNMAIAGPVDDIELSDADRADLATMASFRREESAYSQQQGTKPQTLGLGLNDSPAGLLSWIVEKFRAWSDCDGDPENVFTRDQLITNVMVYWLTETITSSTRLYWERQHAPAGPSDFIDVPTGVARYPKEPLRFPRPWVERRYNVTHWAEMPRGGHFAAMEQPDLFTDDLRTFFLPFSRH